MTPPRIGTCTPLVGPYGRWEVLTTYRLNRKTLCRCRCSCRSDNPVVIVRASNLVTGESLSCGCLQRESNQKRGRRAA